MDAGLHVKASKRGGQHLSKSSCLFGVRGFNLSRKFGLALRYVFPALLSNWRSGQTSLSISAAWKVLPTTTSRRDQEREIPLSQARRNIFYQFGVGAWSSASQSSCLNSHCNQWRDWAGSTCPYRGAPCPLDALGCHKGCRGCIVRSSRLSPIMKLSEQIIIQKTTQVVLFLSSWVCLWLTTQIQPCTAPC